MLGLEIILIIFAWNRGWRFKSLLPISISILIGLFLVFTYNIQLRALVILDICLNLIPTLVMIYKPAKGYEPQSLIEDLKRFKSVKIKVQRKKLIISLVCLILGIVCLLLI